MGFYPTQLHKSLSQNSEDLSGKDGEARDSMGWKGSVAELHMPMKNELLEGGRGSQLLVPNISCKINTNVS